MTDTPNEGKNDGQGAPKEADARKARLSAKLRQNLKRRKDQARSRRSNGQKDES